MSVRALPKDNRFVTWTDWQGYSKFLEAIGDRPIRLTYDQGALEIMSPTQEHERIKTILGHLLVTLVDELGLELEAGGSMTFRREDLDRGLEPDECYWIANAHLVPRWATIDEFRRLVVKNVEGAPVPAAQRDETQPRDQADTSEVGRAEQRAAGLPTAATDRQRIGDGTGEIGKLPLVNHAVEMLSPGSLVRLQIIR